MDVVAQTTERRILDYNPEFSTSSVRTPLRGRRRKQPAGFLQVARVRGADDGVPAPCFAERSTPSSQARSGGFLKTAHRAVFLTETHLIGSNPATGPKTKTTCRISAGCESSWSGRRGSNPRPRPWQGRALPAEPRPREKPSLAGLWFPGVGGGI